MNWGVLASFGLALATSTQGAKAEDAPAPLSPQTNISSATPTQAATPTAVAREEAERRFRRGLEFYEEQEYPLALIEFEKAYQLVPAYQLLFNIAQVSIQVSQFARARVALERYLTEGGAELTVERRAQVEKDLSMLGARTATLLVMTTPAGAEIFVDDVSIGVTPLEEPRLLDAGEHRVTAKKRGFIAKNERVTLAGAEEFKLDVVLVAEEVAPSVAVVIPIEPKKEVVAPQEKSMHPLAIPGWITTGAFAAGATVAGILGAQAAGDLKDLKEQPGSSGSERESAAKKAQGLLVTSDVLLVATGLVLGTTLYFTFWADQNTSPSSRLKQTEVAIGPGLVTFRGQF